ncbi:MAG: DUF86 domain-containing protein [Planctomycetota bacterium]|nr:DUF86 domain-containing protein [Planctomycetota bacterium]
MPRREPSAFVWDIRFAATRLTELVAQTEQAKYVNDQVLQAAAERWLITIGEAINQLAKTDPELAAEMGDVGQIVSFRNFLVHVYFKISPDKVWMILSNDVPALKAAADATWSRFAHQYPEDPPSPP